MVILNLLFVILLLRALVYIGYSEHPVMVGLWFILYVVMVSGWVGLECSRYIGYLVFFVYVGALLVIFCMVVSLAPNPVFRVVPFVGLLPFVGAGIVAGEGGVSGGLRNREVCGELYNGLGVYDGFGWGIVLVWLGLMLLLGMVSVVRMCKWLAGPLVRFNYKGFVLCEYFFSQV